MFIKYDLRDINLGYNGVNIMYKYLCIKIINVFYILFDSKIEWVKVVLVSNYCIGEYCGI